jgi:predicted GH43/DUF377 family glycosyl hydrolase
LGRIYVPPGNRSWARSHAANPVAEHLTDDLFRIYFSTRDDRNRSSIGFIDIDLNDPGEILSEAEEPVLAPGDLAMFDDSGVSIGCIVPIGKRRLLYYMGWHLTVTVPWQNSIGLAISDAPGGPFVRHSRFPIVELNEIDPYTISYPWISVENGRFRMWYGSNIAWGSQKADMRHLIKYAESDDGIHWRREGLIAINFGSPNEYAICKPCVLQSKRGYRMWFCARGEAYRIYAADSSDGIQWTRNAGACLTPSDAGWDSGMVEYPFVFDHKGLRYLLYAGNAFGATGFGLAVEEKRDLTDGEVQSRASEG